MASHRQVLSTYRLQLRGPASGQAFTFADAENLVDYLADLGVSHLYLSPILTASHGSSHGYDVTDPTSVSAEFGGAVGLESLANTAHARGLGIIVDIVPNHVGIETPEQNRWWWDVLTNGRESAYASFFDIDWDLDPDGRIVLPVLGSDDDLAALTVESDEGTGLLRLGDLAFPLAPDTATGGDTGAAVHDRQHYRLTGWRNGVCGYRRFFSITSLAGLRQEDPAVFAANHAEVRRWFDEGLVDGVRIDHPDGLTDPAGYLAMLRNAVGPDAYIVIEKILAVDEALEPTLDIAGSTGYDVLREIGGLFVDPAGVAALTELAASAELDYAEIPSQVAELKTAAATETLSSELNRLRRSIITATGTDHPRLPDAITALLTNLHVYRSDYRGLSAMLSNALSETATAQPDLAAPLQVLAAAVNHHEPAARLQQLCGAVTAKAIEDCLFYRDARLVSLNEVGGEPERFGVSAAEFHHRAAVRAQLWPTTMSALTTHDTKRGEDVRARIAVLSQLPGLWTELIAEWERLTPSPDTGTALFVLQNIFGVWPIDGTVTDTLRDRLHGYAEKAMREAQVHTSWIDPDEQFEAAVHGWLDAVLTGPVATEMTALVARVDRYARSDALGQKLLALTVPGVPDTYQGTELWEDSLVDPDNRRPVDYAARRGALAEATHPKIRVVHAALQLRRRRPDSFLAGGHIPVLANGSAAEHVISYLRGQDVLVAVSRWTAGLEETGWGDTVLTLPTGAWSNVLTGADYTGTIAAAELFADLPVALLERADA